MNREFLIKLLVSEDFSEYTLESSVDGVVFESKEEYNLTDCMGNFREIYFRLLEENDFDSRFDNLIININLEQIVFIKKGE